MRQLELDFTQAEINKQNGIEVAELNAEFHHPEWSTEALVWLCRFLRNYSFDFMTEDVRLFAESNGFKAPVTSRSWGAVMLRASRAGIIKKVGYKSTRNPLAHRTPATLWSKA